MTAGAAATAAVLFHTGTTTITTSTLLDDEVQVLVDFSGALLHDGPCGGMAAPLCAFSSTVARAGSGKYETDEAEGQVRVEQFDTNSNSVKLSQFSVFSGFSQFCNCNSIQGCELTQLH